MDYAFLTGQTRYTIELFSPIRNIWNRARDWIRSSTTAAGIAWMSKYVYNYHRLMLMNLSPREPATHHWPLYYYPPPHFLVGYQFIVRTCNEYIFDVRSYSRLRYHDLLAPNQQFVNWSTLCNCSYTIDTGAYHRFVDLDNFEQTLFQIQQAVLAERIVADLALIRPLRGYGRTNIEDDEDVPIEQILTEHFKDLGQCQQEAWGMADRIRIQRSNGQNAEILRIIRRLKAAYFRYLTYTDKDMLSLPCECDWVEAFMDHFCPQDLEMEPGHLQEMEPQVLLKAVISALSLPSPFQDNLRGGAFELRAREDGRAVTETMRRRRGEVIERFIDRLPIRTRRRRRTPSPSPPSSVDLEEALVQEAIPTFEEEIRNTISGIIRALEEELTVSARDHTFFNFVIHFYETMSRLENMGEISETVIRRWVMNFFIAEHLATTLNYLHSTLIQSPQFTRHLELILAQIVLRGRDEMGNVIFSRVWSEDGSESFPNLMRRIAIDLAGNVERAGYEEINEDELEQFMTDIAFHENSGDIQEVLKQVGANDANIDSVELSFRFKIMGPVIFSQKREIQNINRRVITLATQLRRQRQPLPTLNQVVHLPPI
ncbi:pTP [Polar bear adenovirus 1]|uniref:Preterminal protein n=1 Tax=Polar bear adenovirus 1 TaxID=2250215 RepID=A0A2Z4QJM7_9ADEN|nr:pTP [Polar bear adenovirus 1]